MKIEKDIADAVREISDPRLTPQNINDVIESITPDVLKDLKLTGERLKLPEDRIVEEGYPQIILNGIVANNLWRELYAKELQDVQLAYIRTGNHPSILNLRREYNVPEDGLLGSKYENIDFDFDKQREKWRKIIGPNRIKKWQKDISFLMDELGIQERFRNTVESSFLFNEKITMDIMAGDPKEKIGVFIKKNDYGRKELLLRLDVDTTKKDLQSPELWERINNFKAELSPIKVSTQRVKESLRTLEQIYEWHKDGLTYKKINERLSELGMDSLSDFQSIGTLISRYKGIVGLDKGNKTRKKNK